MIDCAAPHYTHEAHARACAEAAAAKRPLQKFVQVNYHGCVQCAKIIDAWDDPDGRPMWKVDLIGEVKGKMSFPVRHVRDCSATDGRCQCDKNFALPSTNG